MSMSENSVPLKPMVLLIIIPIKWLFHWEYTLFSDKPKWVRFGYDSGTIQHDLIFHKAGAVDSDLGSRALLVAMLLPKHQVLATSKRHEIGTRNRDHKRPQQLPLGLQPKSPWQSHQRFCALHSMCQGQSVFALANSRLTKFGSPKSLA